MLNELKRSVFDANINLVKNGLVILTWGNVSGFDRGKGLMVIKPSGISYERLKPEQMVVVDLNGDIVEGKLKPSSDSQTHLTLYNKFPAIKGVVHTHSLWATTWAQAGKEIPVLGTTHADYFNGNIPCTRELTGKEIEENYESETGNVIVETFDNLEPMEIPGVLVRGHGPFTWGEDPGKALENSVVMEKIAKMAFNTFLLEKKPEFNRKLLDKHFLRKHGKDSYYGQE